MKLRNLIKMVNLVDYIENSRNLDLDIKDKIGEVYLKHIVGIDDKTLKKFILGDVITSYEVGMTQTESDGMVKKENLGQLDNNEIRMKKRDYSAFWNEISKILPKSLSQNKLESLIQDSNDLTLPNLLYCLDSDNNNPSLIRKIITNLENYHDNSIFV